MVKGCICEDKGTCIACLITKYAPDEEKIKHHLGAEGLQYYLEHMK